jgi:sugar lactone lactonase YvrE
MLDRDRVVVNLSRWVLLSTTTAIMAACQSAPVKPSPSPTPSLTPTPIAACPSTPAATGPQVLLRNQPAPDDLVFDSDGRLLFTDITKGTLSLLLADGSVQVLAFGLSEPEGIVVQNDGRILVAEQGRNRIVAVDPQSHAVSQWRAFPNRTANAGIDGIGPQLSSGEVVVPDSPNGVVWRVSADGKTSTQIAAGMVRPVGAAIDAGGRIFVADEGNTLWVLDPAKHRFVTLPTPDDVLVGRDGHLFVNTLGDNAIHELDAQGHQLNVLRGIAQPQGIALDGADNLYYTEFNSGRIDRVVRNFILDPPTVTRVGPSTFEICPSIRRAAGFTQPVSLSAGSSKATLVLQLVQPGTDSSGALEVRTSERTVTIRVTAPLSLTLSQTIDLPQ